MTGGPRRRPTVAASEAPKRRPAKPEYDSTGYLVLRAGSIPLRTKTLDESFYQELDPGIRFAVRVLHAAGFDTCQSCQGGEGAWYPGRPHPYDHPTVDIAASEDDSTVFGALHALREFGLPVSQVAIVWPIRNGIPYEKLWRIEFAGSMEDRADDRCMFIWGYQAQENVGR